MRAGPRALPRLATSCCLRTQSFADTDWAQIAGLYRALLELAPSPVVRLNHAVAVAMSEGPAAGLRLMDELASEGKLGSFHLLSAARADLLRRLGRFREASEAYRQALELVGNEPERRFLERRLADALAQAATNPA